VRHRASLTTLELFDAGANTKLRLTSQVTLLIGQDMIESHEIGINASLDNLCGYFDKT
jgi:hypothetical protein